MGRDNYPWINSEFPWMDLVSMGVNTEFAGLDMDFSLRQKEEKKADNLIDSIESRDEN
jgi:hypothetical protein